MQWYTMQKSVSFDDATTVHHVERYPWAYLRGAVQGDTPDDYLAIAQCRFLRLQAFSSRALVQKCIHRWWALVIEC